MSECLVCESPLSREWGPHARLYHLTEAPVWACRDCDFFHGRIESVIYHSLSFAHRFRAKEEATLIEIETMARPSKPIERMDKDSSVQPYWEDELGRESNLSLDTSILSAQWNEISQAEDADSGQVLKNASNEHAKDANAAACSPKRACSSDEPPSPPPQSQSRLHEDDDSARSKPSDIPNKKPRAKSKEQCQQGALSDIMNKKPRAKSKEQCQQGALSDIMNKKPRAKSNEQCQQGALSDIMNKKPRAKSNEQCQQGALSDIMNKKPRPKSKEQCQQCWKQVVVSSRRDLLRHARSCAHIKTHRCSGCGKQSACRDAVAAHIKASDHPEACVQLEENEAELEAAVIAAVRACFNQTIDPSQNPRLSLLV